jgi:hypothetical protein
MTNDTDTATATADPSGYEPPCIEQVLDAEDLEREVLYAGLPTPG